MPRHANGDYRCVCCSNTFKYTNYGMPRIYCSNKCSIKMKNVRKYKHVQNVCFCGKIIYGRKHCSEWHGRLWRTYGKEM